VRWKGLLCDKFCLLFCDIFEVIIEVLEPQLVIIIARSSPKLDFPDYQMTFCN
jgi:hypothetical protein